MTMNRGKYNFTRLDNRQKKRKRKNKWSYSKSYVKLQAYTKVVQVANCRSLSANKETSYCTHWYAKINIYVL